MLVDISASHMIFQNDLGPGDYPVCLGEWEQKSHQNRKQAIDAESEVSQCRNVDPKNRQKLYLNWDGPRDPE